jgi:alpha-tubulin suppressor-like RCC1 family protein
LRKLDLPGKPRQIAFTKGFMWGLNQKGELFQWPIAGEPTAPGADPSEGQRMMILNKPRKVEALGSETLVQIATGEDHIAMLTSKGEVFTMGDDTYGQCGQGPNGRKSAPPFYQQRVRAPIKVENLSKIKRIACGGNHTLALSNDGMLFGWGSNSALQLSHEKEFASVEEPLIGVFSPVRLDGSLPNNFITNIAAGSEFTMVVTKNRANEECEVYGTGMNLHGQLCSGGVRHISDFVKAEGLSNYDIESPSEPGKNMLVTVDEISCGNNHCMALLNIGIVLEWGSNEYGQLGNRKRVFQENPLILANIQDCIPKKVACGHNNSAVIGEPIEAPKPQGETAKSK